MAGRQKTLEVGRGKWNILYRCWMILFTFLVETVTIISVGKADWALSESEGTIIRENKGNKIWKTEKIQQKL